MSKERDTEITFDPSILGLASLLYDEVRSTEQISLRLERLVFRRSALPAILVVIAITLASFFLFVITKTPDNDPDRIVLVIMASVVTLVILPAFHIYHSSTSLLHSIRAELDESVENLRRLVEKISQYDEYRKLQPLEKFVIELRLATADKVLRKASRTLHPHASRAIRRDT